MQPSNTTDIVNQPVTKSTSSNAINNISQTDNDPKNEDNILTINTNLNNSTPPKTTQNQTSGGDIITSPDSAGLYNSNNFDDEKVPLVLKSAVVGNVDGGDGTDAGEEGNVRKGVGFFEKQGELLNRGVSFRSLVGNGGGNKANGGDDDGQEGGMLKKQKSGLQLSKGVSLRNVNVNLNDGEKVSGGGTSLRGSLGRVDCTEKDKERDKQYSLSRLYHAGSIKSIPRGVGGSGVGGAAGTVTGSSQPRLSLLQTLSWNSLLAIGGRISQSVSGGNSQKPSGNDESGYKYPRPPPRTTPLELSDLPIEILQHIFILSENENLAISCRLFRYFVAGEASIRAAWLLNKYGVRYALARCWEWGFMRMAQGYHRDWDNNEGGGGGGGGDSTGILLPRSVSTFTELQKLGWENERILMMEGSEAGRDSESGGGGCCSAVRIKKGVSAIVKMFVRKHYVRRKTCSCAVAAAKAEAAILQGNGDDDAADIDGRRFSKISRWRRVLSVGARLFSLERDEEGVEGRDSESESDSESGTDNEGARSRSQGDVNLSQVVVDSVDVGETQGMEGAQLGEGHSQATLSL
ncbi:hypothetical protein HDU76_004613, partial [Blyttiomyces sp. JEL0837]